MPIRASLRWTIHAAVATAGVLTLALHAGSQTPPPGDDPRFTGRSTVLDAKDLSAARRRFDPGARSAWHSHDNGQLLYVEEGRMRTQKRGQPVQELGVGESDYTGPKVVHWHGAAAGTHLIQVNVGFGGETRWMQKVTDAEYAGK
ncbi:MAG: cupin domain-containing protein [Vicinamibacterales bacterium]